MIETLNQQSQIWEPGKVSKHICTANDPWEWFAVDEEGVFGEEGEEVTSASYKSILQVRKEKKVLCIGVVQVLY